MTPAEAAKQAQKPVIRFVGFTDAWEQRKLGELFDSGGSGGTPSASNSAYYDGNINFLGISDVHERFISETKKTITQKGLQNSAAWVVPKGTLSLAMYASVGVVGICSIETATSQAFYNMIFRSNSLRDFVFTRLEKANQEREWEPLVSTGTQRNLNSAKVKGFAIGVPGEEETSKIASFFLAVDNAIVLHQRELFL